MINVRWGMRVNRSDADKISMWSERSVLKALLHPKGPRAFERGCRRSGRFLALGAFGAFLLFSGAGFAQTSPADDFARRQAAEQRREQIESLRAQTPRGESVPRLSDDMPLPADGACFEIDQVVVEGAVKLSSRNISHITQPHANSCIGLKEIQSLLRDLTNAYLERGYVTARAYIPVQDIRNSRELKLVIIEGKLGDIYLNGKAVSPYNGVIMSAFPGLNDKPVNMRDVEQGLDQINRLSSNNAKSEMLPGKDAGHTILNVTNQPSKPWHVSLNHDNLGQASTGYARGTVDVRLDNVLKINDLWSFSYQRTGTDYWKDNNAQGSSNSYSGSVSIPHGYWTFTLSGYLYDYNSEVPGNFGMIETSGDSSELRGQASRVLHRDGKSITTLDVGLAYKETNNFLLGNRIEVGSRQYSVGNIGLSHSRQMWTGTWTFNLNYSQGLGLFGAVEKGDPGAGDADPEFSKFVATISAMTPFKLGEQNLLLSNLLVGQYASNNLFGAEQMSLGSYSNVRGSRDSLVYGNNGFFTRNDLIWRTLPWGNNAPLTRTLGELRPYAGIDYGQVFAQSDYGFEDETLASWTVGAKLAGGVFTMDVGYSEIFAGTARDNAGGLAFANVTVNF